MRVPQPLHWYIGDETSRIPYESGQLVASFVFANEVILDQVSFAQLHA